jgi:hypothetical protein
MKDIVYILDYFFFLSLSFFAVLGFQLGAYTLRHSISPFFVMGFFFFEIGSQELFAWAGFEPHPPDLCLLSS